MKTEISTPKAPAAIGPYPQAIKSGDMIFCSGQVPLDPTTGKLVGGTIEDDVNQIFLNITNVLSASDAKLDNIIKTTIYLKDMNDFNAVNEIYGSYFSKPFPARSTVEVSKLPLNCRVEIEVIAKV